MQGGSWWVWWACGVLAVIALNKPLWDWYNRKAGGMDDEGREPVQHFRRSWEMELAPAEGNDMPLEGLVTCELHWPVDKGADMVDPDTLERVVAGLCGAIMQMVAADAERMREDAEEGVRTMRLEALVREVETGRDSA